MASSNGYLLDTHIFIWWMDKNSRRLGNLAKILSDPKNTIFLSVVSVWEMIVKQSKGSLKLPKDIKSGIKASGFTILPISDSHVFELENLPLHHQDPFDRMLIAQAAIENLTLITLDKKIDKYGADTLGN